MPLDQPPPRRRAPTFHAHPDADARQLLGALLPRRAATARHVQQAHARLAVLGLATARVLPHLLAALPRLPPLHDDASSSYPLSLFRRSNSSSAFASNHLLRVLPHPLPLRLFPGLPRRNPHSFTFLLSSISSHLDADRYGGPASSSLGSHVHALAVKAGAAGDLYVRNALTHFYSVCGDVGAMRRVFDELPRVRDVVTWNAILAGYVRAGMARVAREVFDEMPVRDEVSWSTVVGGYVKEGELDVALALFRDMVEKGVRVNEAAVVTALSAAAQLGLLEHGRFVHQVVHQEGMPISVNVGAAMVDMYAKCGCVAVAREVFDGMPRRDVFAWNAMICGLASHGLGQDAVELFERFLGEGLCPTNITFVGVLNACSRFGLVAEGRRYFESMAEKYSVEPEMEHYGCMVDLLGRAGLVPEAIELIEGMPIAPDPVLWGTVLSACKKHGLVDLGVKVGNKLIELEPAHDGHYVLLASIYAKAKKWDAVREVRKLMSSRGTSKSAGWSLMEAQGNVHKFLVGDMDHKDSIQIYNMLDMINRRLADAGYVPDVSSVLHDIGDEDKAHAIKVHSERLAIAYGFIVTEVGNPIRIVKNLQVCGDCHEFNPSSFDIVSLLLLKFPAGFFNPKLWGRPDSKFYTGVCAIESNQMQTGSAISDFILKEMRWLSIRKFTPVNLGERIESTTAPGLEPGGASITVEVCILEDGTEELQLVKSLRREGQVVKIQDVGVSQGLGLRDLVVDEKGVKLGEAKNNDLSSELMALMEEFKALSISSAVMDSCFQWHNIVTRTRSGVNVHYFADVELWRIGRVFLFVGESVATTVVNYGITHLAVHKSQKETAGGMAMAVAEARLRQEKVKKFEDFVDRRLKPDLVNAIAQRDNLFQQQKTFLDLKKNIENLEKNGVTSMRSMVNLGSEVYMQAEVPDTRHIFVDIGLGFHVEFTWQEALQFISVREARLARQIDEYTHLIASIKAQIKMVCEGIRELLQLPAE
ncbi:pentatricopeptide repeat-containing protein [Hordeum vulgare]|nr:pentatricopeptide repeat-containing protein [Hordeum vulgare]